MNVFDDVVIFIVAVVIAAFATRSDAAVVEEHRIAGSEEPFRPEELEKTSSSGKLMRSDERS